MRHAYPYALTKREVEILKTIFAYRGLRANDIAVFLHRTFSYTLSDEKSVYNYLNKLKGRGLIKSHRLQNVNSLGSVYYLTSKGLEVVKEILNIAVSQQGDGMLPINDSTNFWDIPFEYQMPPLKQVEHFLQTIECLQQFIVNQKESFEHQTAHYSNLNYIKYGKEYKVRPDSTVYVNRKRYTIEIDRATESHEQLVQKFRGYKEHYNYCQSVTDKSTVKPVHSILFVLAERTRDHGIKRRWANVLSAFLKAFDEDFPHINLILTTVNDVAKTLMFEKHRKELEKKAFQSVLRQVEKEGFNPMGILAEKYYVITNPEKKQCRLLAVQVHQEFESRILKDIYDMNQFDFDKMKKIIESNKSINGYESLTGVSKWWSPYSMPQFPHGVDKLLTKKDFIQKVTSVKQFFDKYQFEMFDSNVIPRGDE